MVTCYEPIEVTLKGNPLDAMEAASWGTFVLAKDYEDLASDYERLKSRYDKLLGKLVDLYQEG